MKNLLFTLSFLILVPSIACAAEWPSDSIFWFDSTWTTHEGKSIKLSELSKSPSIVSMVFLNCSYSCPITIGDMKQMEKIIEKIPSRKRGPYRLVLISIDPKRDSPEEMRKYMKTHNLNPSRWLIMTSSPKNIRELAAQLGFSYREDKAMEFAHSMLTWVFDRQGVRQMEIQGRIKSPRAVADKLKELW